MAKTKTAKAPPRPVFARLKNKVYTGRFVPCPASYISHTQLVGCEVQLGKSYFALCPCCTTRMFLNMWEEDWGFTLKEILERGGVAPGISPQRHQELISAVVPTQKRSNT